MLVVFADLFSERVVFIWTLRTVRLALCCTDRELPVASRSSSFETLTSFARIAVKQEPRGSVSQESHQQSLHDSPRTAISATSGCTRLAVRERSANSATSGASPHGDGALRGSGHRWPSTPVVLRHLARPTGARTWPASLASAETNEWPSDLSDRELAPYRIVLVRPKRYCGTRFMVYCHYLVSVPTWTRRTTQSFVEDAFTSTLSGSVLVSLGGKRKTKSWGPTKGDTGYPT